MKAATVYNSAEGLPELEIATVDNIADNVGNFLQCSTYDTDLKDYIKKDKISLRLNTTTDELILSDHEGKVPTEFFVDARILGI